MALASAIGGCGERPPQSKNTGRPWQHSASLLGDAPAFRAAVDLAARLSACEVTALIQGETGTGKELIARAIHYLGKRASGPFVPVNCGALPDTLVESELFGHVRGAYTDAREAHSGLIGQAEGGTLFLDEIEAMAPQTQVKLLRFLQDLQYRPVGSHTARAANVRVIAATNADLAELVAKGHWREDLLFRLQVVPLHIPPLRGRGDDVLLLARHFSSRYAERYGVSVREIHPGCIPGLRSYDWPGNVRELENLVHRQFLLDTGPLLKLDPVPVAAGARDDTRRPMPTSEPAPAPITGQPFREAKADAIRQFERAYLEELLERARGNISAASRLCGKERRDLGRLLRKHGLLAESQPDGAANTL